MGKVGGWVSAFFLQPFSLEIGQIFFLLICPFFIIFKSTTLPLLILLIF